jgi:hypothetical protein
MLVDTAMSAQKFKVKAQLKPLAIVKVAAAGLALSARQGK